MNDTLSNSNSSLTSNSSVHSDASNSAQQEDLNHDLSSSSTHLKEENDRVENETKELSELYKQKNMEFHKREMVRMREGSLLNLEKKGLVKEISAKFQTPDTASYTRPSTTVTVKERIINQRKAIEKKKQDNENHIRERVIVLSTDPISNVDVIINKMTKSYHTSEAEKPSSPTKELQGGGDTAGSTVENRDVEGTTDEKSKSLSSPDKTFDDVKRMKTLGRRRRGRLELLNPNKGLGLEKKIQTYLFIPPNPKPQVKVDRLNQLVSTKTVDFLKKLVENNLGTDSQNIQIVNNSNNNSNDHYFDDKSSSSIINSNSSSTSALFHTDTAQNTAISLRIKALKTPFKVLFIFPNESTKILQCKGTDTIETIKVRLVNEYLASFLPSPPSALNTTPAKTTAGETEIVYKYGAESYAIVDINGQLQSKSTTLNKSDYIIHCRGNGLLPKLRMIEKSQLIDPDPSGELSGQDCETIKQLVGAHEWKGEEIEDFRRVTARLRYEELNNIKGTIQSILQVKLSPLPIPIHPKGYIYVNLPIMQCIKTLEVIPGETADQFTARVFERNYSKQLPNVKSTDFILKAVGFSDFIHGPYDLRTFETIRNSIIQGVKANLTLIQKPKIEMDPPPFKPRFDFPPEIAKDFEVSNLSSKDKFWDHIPHISIRDIKRPLRLKVIRCSNIPCKKDDDSMISVIVYIAIFHGVECISKAATSFTSVPPSSLFTSTNPSIVDWNEYLTFPNMDYCNLPMDARLCISVYATAQNSSGDSVQLPTMTGNSGDQIEITSGKKDFPIGWVNLMLSDYKSQLQSGLLELSLWPDEVANPLGTCSQNQASNSVRLLVEFEEFSNPIVFPHRNVKTPVVEPPTINSNDMREFFESIVNLDPLSDLSKEKYQQLWALRHYSMLFPQVLPRLMLSVPWCNANAVDEAHSFIDKWPKIKPYEALELLDAKHANRVVRAYAVSCLEELDEEELLDILLQLVQVLKYEPYHDSQLARFLLKKAILNRTIGHSFFWYLKSDLHVPNVSERFGILLEAYLHACGTHRYDLLKQQIVIENLTDVAKKIKPLKDQDRREYMLRELEAIDWPKRFHLTLNPKYESNGLIYNKCKYMDSKKLPLRLSFTNTDIGADTIEVIFKSGDDLRQDMLTLQMIRLMDKLWQKESLDLKLSPYGCISTGDQIGMIEVVLNAETTAKIQKLAGGATAAFKLDPLDNWLRAHNKTEPDYQRAVDTFILSCAGYCVATYVLGIGDRHNDNLMCTKLGRLFHIDFGHFLGNYKKKFGFKRERAPFVFTPDFCYVMGGKDSPKFFQFVNYCCNAYNILRKNAKLFMNLFAMMVSTGIPELQSMDDLNYLKESFSLELSDEKAREKFTNLIYESLTTKTTQLNNAIHILAH